MREHEQADAVIERAVRNTVGRQLDLQQGKSAAAFARMLAGAEGAGHEHGDRRGGMAAPRRASEVWRLRFWAGTASALAACLACVVGLQLWTHAGSTTKTPTDVGAPAMAAAPVMHQEEFRRDVDAGTIVMEDTPIRVVRQQTVKHTRWFDPQEKATYSVTEPIEKVGYEKLQPY